MNILWGESYHKNRGEEKSHYNWFYIYFHYAVNIASVTWTTVETTPGTATSGVSEAPGTGW